MTDEEAMQAVGQGDLDKASLLFERYHQRVYRFFVGMGTGHDTAQDLAQQLFLRVLKYGASYKEGKPFKAWLFQIARNLAADHFKNNGPWLAGEDKALGLPDTADLPGDGLMRAERHEALVRALALMPPEQREIIVLSRIEEMKYSEIAALNGSTEGAVKVSAHRALKKLREIYFKTAG